MPGDVVREELDLLERRVEVAWDTMVNGATPGEREGARQAVGRMLARAANVASAARRRAAVVGGR